MKVFNFSTNRTARHVDNGMVYAIEPMMLMEIPNDIAQAMMRSWPDVRPQEEPETKIAQEPWETKTGPAWDAAVKQHNIDLNRVKETVGAARPPVVEPVAPADAVDPETGHVNEALLNTHLCTYCQREFKQITRLRTHQRKEHQI